MNRIEIAKGASLIALPAEKFKRCRISIHFVWEASKQAATTQALLPLVLERGYADCPDMTELSKRLAGLYGAAFSVDTGIMGASRVLTVSISGIQDAFALAGENLTEEYAKIAFGTAFRPYFVDGLFDAQTVEIEREQLREMLESEINEKRSYCIRQARRKFFGDAPQGVEPHGYLQEVDSITPQMLTDEFNTMLRTAKIEVIVQGANANAVEQELLQALSSIDRAPQEKDTVPAMPRQDEQAFTQAMDTVQGKLCLLFTAGAPISVADNSALRVAVALLGGTATSRLFLNVREKESLCYYCAASFQAVSASMCIDSGIEHEQAHQAKAAILRELKALCTGEITQKELDETKRVLCNALTSVGDSLAGVENWLFAEIMRGTNQTTEEVKAEIQNVTAQDVQRVLSQFSLSVSYLITKEDAHE